MDKNDEIESTDNNQMIFSSHSRIPSSSEFEWLSISASSNYNSDVSEPYNTSPVVEGTDDTQSFFVENGKQCIMVGAREFKIEWGESPKKWKWISHRDSRFTEVAQAKEVWWLDVRCMMDTRMLSRETIYGAYLVFKLADQEAVYGFESVGGVVRFVNQETSSDATKRAFLLHLQQRHPTDPLVPRQTGRLAVRRDDGWMEIELGDFYNDQGDDGEVEASFFEKERVDRKSGLIVEGIEFRPKESFTSSVLLNDLKPNLFEDERTGNQCVLVGARELIIVWGENPKKWKWTTLSEAGSRFSEVAQLKVVYWLDIKCKIDTRMLSPNTTYAAYLVYKLADKNHGLESVKGVIRLTDSEPEDEAAERASILYLQQGRSALRQQAGRCAVLREDGWMEIELGEFYNEEGDDDLVEARLMEIERMHDKKCGLIVEAIEFRPKTSLL